MKTANKLQPEIQDPQAKKIGRPRKLSDAERKEKRRLNSKKWRKNNLEKSREIVRRSMKKASDASCIARGRKPGQLGPSPLNLTLEQKRAKQNARVKRYYHEHKESSRLHGAVAARNRRARLRNNGGTHTADDIKQLWLLQKGKCTFCLQSFGEETPDVDHRVPLILGGKNDRSNLQLLHPTCNRQKLTQHPLDHAKKHGMLFY